MNDTSDIERTCEALHKVNKHAKKYAQLADQNYTQGKKATAKLNSLKKKALYELKSKVLKRLYDHGYHDRVELHEIDGRDYYCFYIEGWSYHTPVSDWPWNKPRSNEVGAERSLNNFSGSCEANTDMSLKSALIHLHEEFGCQFSANNFLDKERVKYGRQSYFAGWRYLG